MVAYVRLVAAGCLSRRQAPMSHLTTVRTTPRNARTLIVRCESGPAVG
jgi:hypothetical protein